MEPFVAFYRKKQCKEPLQSALQIGVQFSEWWNHFFFAYYISRSAISATNWYNFNISGKSRMLNF